jgi:hypothetical protein
MMQLSAFASGSVTLAWSANTNPIVAGYNIYYGGACGVYTNKICAGKATNATLSGLCEGSTYYFAATTYSVAGMESSYCNEVSYLVPRIIPTVVYSNNYSAVITTNQYRFRTNTLPSGKKKVLPLAATWTNYVFNGFSVNYPSSGTWILQSSSNLLTWTDYVTGTNSVYVPYTGGNRYFRFKSQ